MKDDGNLILRGRKYSLRRYLPARYRSVDTREDVWVPLHTDSHSQAKEKAQKVQKTHIAGWEARLAVLSFEERLRKAEIDELLRTEILGHACFLEKYGEPKLHELTEARQRIAL